MQNTPKSVYTCKLRLTSNDINAALMLCSLYPQLHVMAGQSREKQNPSAAMNCLVIFQVQKIKMSLQGMFGNRFLEEKGSALLWGNY